MAEAQQTFDSFEQWVNKANSWLRRHPQYNNVEHGKAGYRGTHFTALCFDTAGRICRNGADMMRARDEGCFPVRWLWPDQVPELVRALKLATEFGCDHCGENLLVARSLAGRMGL
jgi:hypothetical protein